VLFDFFLVQDVAQFIKLCAAVDLCAGRVGDDEVWRTLDVEVYDGLVDSTGTQIYRGTQFDKLRDVLNKKKIK
jgi:hypothetical protein